MKFTRLKFQLRDDNSPSATLFPSLRDSYLPMPACAHGIWIVVRQLVQGEFSMLRTDPIFSLK